MIKVTVLYPGGDGIAFDVDYYLNTHIPMVIEAAGDALRRIEVDRGLRGRLPESEPPYLAIVHMFFDSVDAHAESMGPHSERLGADVANFTNATRILQFSEIAR